MYPAQTLPILPSIVCISGLLLSGQASFALAAPAELPPITVNVTDAREPAFAALRDAVIYHEETRPTAHAPVLKDLLKCQLLHLPVHTAPETPIQWVVIADEECEPAFHGAKTAWLVGTKQDQAHVFLAGTANSISFSTHSLLLYLPLELPPEVSQRIPLAHQAARCAIQWTWEEGKYTRTAQTEPTLLVNDPVAGGWIEMPLSQYVPDYPRTLCAVD